MKKRIHGKKRAILALAVIMAALVLLAACGGIGDAGGTGTLSVAASAPAAAPTAPGGLFEENNAMATEDAQMSPQEGGTGAAGTGEGQTGGESGNNALSQGRKIIMNASVELETQEFDATVNGLRSAIDTTGGYVSSFSTSGSMGYRNSATIVSRIPAEKYNEFLNTVSAAGNVVQRSESTEDITAQYVDVEARMKALETQYNRLLELAEKAETIEDLLYIQQQLTEIQYQIEYYTSIMRTYDNLVAYSTVTIHIYEVKEITPPAPESYWSKFTSAFANAWRNAGIFFQDLGLFLASALPALLLLAAIIVAAILLIKRSRKLKAKNGPKSKPGPTTQNPPDNNTPGA